MIGDNACNANLLIFCSYQIKLVFIKDNLLTNGLDENEKKMQRVMNRNNINSNKKNKGMANNINDRSAIIRITELSPILGLKKK